MEELLPREERIHWILDKSARLVEGGAVPVSGLVLPTGRHFPDRYDGSPEALQRLLMRVAKHAGLSDLELEANLVVPEGESAGGSCSSGACGVPSATQKQVRRVEEMGEGYKVNIIANELGNPIILMTALVRAIGHIFLQEADLAHTFDRSDYDHGIDLTATMLGFGTILGNGAYVYRKG
ncbi:MAG TPA: hypothetical protein ENK57_21130, partial [Polyangiaceae bacterium]|nr:hypothetical protein [Polyangiaceae bacterium]